MPGDDGGPKGFIVASRDEPPVVDLIGDIELEAGEYVDMRNLGQHARRTPSQIG